MKKAVHLAIAAALVLCYAGIVQARSGYLSTFNGLYSTANTRLDTCDTCHVPGGKARNPYGLAMEAKLVAGYSESQALTAVESADSDGDTYSNITEINALKFPGNAADHPSATPSYCPDADGDGFVVCDGVCVVPAGKQCGDCNDANPLANPGAVEGPFGNATCGDGFDNNCNTKTDAADAACAVPAAADYDITGFTANGRVSVGRKITLKVTVQNMTTSNPGATLTLYGTQNGANIPITTDLAISASATYTFTYIPTAVGTISWVASVTDADPDADQATATTTVR